MLAKAFTSTVVLGLAAAATGALATFECEKVWSRPSKDNSITTCVGTASHIQELALDPGRSPYSSGIVVSLLILIFMLLCCPFVTIMRYVCRCCGSYRRRPGAFCGGAEWDEAPEAVKRAGYDERCRKVAVILPWVVLIVCVAPMGVLLRGADTIKVSYDGIFDDVGGLATYMENKLAAIRTGMSDKYGRLIPFLQQSYFDSGNDLVSSLRGSLRSSKSSFESYVTLARTVAIVIGIIPMVFFALNVIASCCHIRRILPLINSFFMLILVIVYGIVAFVLFVIALLLRDTCDEVGVWNANHRPGLFSWYVQPLCDSVAPFEKMRDQIDGIERDAAKLACDGLMAICNSSANATWNSNNSNVIFECFDLTNSTANCTTFAAVTAIVGRASVMPTAAAQLSNFSCSGSPCTVRNCSESCTPTSIQTSANSSITNMDYADQAFRTFTTHVRPLLDCGNVMDVALGSFSSCEKIQLSTYYIAVGALLFEFLAAVSVVVIWIGQKRWFEVEGVDEADESAGDGKNEPTAQGDAPTLRQTRRRRIQQAAAQSK